MSVTPYLLKEALRSQAEPSFHRPSDPRLTQGASLSSYGAEAPASVPVSRSIRRPSIQSPLSLKESSPT